MARGLRRGLATGLGPLRPGQRLGLGLALALALGLGLACLALPAGAADASTSSPAAPAPASPPSDWQAELLPPDGEVRGREDPLVLAVPPLPAAVADRLFFELDGLDVGAWAELAPERVVLRPAAPLEHGAHELRVHERMPDGTWVSRGAFPFQVRRFPWLAEAGTDTLVTVEVERRMGDHGLRNPPERVQVRGSLDARANLAGDDWSVDARLPVLYDREAGSPAGGRSWDLADYLVEARYRDLGVRAGHHAPPLQSLILENFHRRGVSATWDLGASLGEELGGLRSRVTGFSLRTEPITGWNEGSGLTDHDHRTSGVMWSAEPLRHPHATLSLAGTYLRGRGEAGGAAVSGAPGLDAVRSGTAWDGVARLSLLSGRVDLRAEYARTRFDFDGEGGEPAVRDEAVSYRGRVVPWLDRSFLGHPFHAELQVEYRRVGPAFRSIANPFAPTDRDLLDARGRLEWAGLAVTGSFAREKNNVDEVDELPRFRNDNFAVDAAWRPPWLHRGERTGWRRWAGALVVGGGWSRDRLKPIHEPEPPEGMLSSAAFGIARPPLADETRRRAYGTLGSSYERWGWNVSHTVLRFTDNVDGSVRTRSDETAGDVWLQLGPRVSITARLQRFRFKDLVTEDQDVSWLGGVGVNAVLWPEHLDGTVTFDWSRMRNSTSTLDTRTGTVTAALNWYALQPRGDRPGLTVTVYGSGQDVQLTSRGGQRAWQVFLRATLSWRLVR